MSEFPRRRHVLEPDCRRCPALVDARERISWGTGPLEASVAVVGEAPGYGDPDADRWRGGNWTGRANQDVWIDRLGYDAGGYRTAVGDRLDELVTDGEPPTKP